MPQVSFRIPSRYCSLPLGGRGQMITAHECFFDAVRDGRSRRRSVEQLIADFEDDRAVMEDIQETRRVPDMAGAVALLAARGLLPAIWFIFSRKDCELAAARIGRSSVTLCSPVRHLAVCTKNLQGSMVPLTSPCAIAAVEGGCSRMSGLQSEVNLASVA